MNRLSSYVAKSSMIATLLCVAGVAAAQTAQNYPSKPIKFIVGFPAGGDPEPMVRGLADHFTKLWGQPVVVEYKPGAQQRIAYEEVARAAPDGHTLLMCNIGATTINPTLYPNVQYKIGENIAPISFLASATMVLISGPKLGARSYAEVIAAAKKSPGKIAYAASGGAGNVTHMAGQLFMREAGVDLMYVPYKGTQAVVADLLGGHVDMYFQPMPSARAYLTGHPDKVKPIAVTSLNRSSYMPEVPTLNELGLKGFDVNTWFGLCTTGGTPKDIIKKLADAVADGERNGLAAKWREFGLTARSTTPEQFTEMIRKETTLWAKVIKENGIKPD
jgi:tripartite-type tricarboxylate transporter receptor subunit TctC